MMGSNCPFLCVGFPFHVSAVTWMTAQPNSSGNPNRGKTRCNTTCDLTFVSSNFQLLFRLSKSWFDRLYITVSHVSFKSNFTNINFKEVANKATKARKSWSRTLKSAVSRCFYFHFSFWSSDQFHIYSSPSKNTMLDTFENGN